MDYNGVKSSAIDPQYRLLGGGGNVSQLSNIKDYQENYEDTIQELINKGGSKELEVFLQTTKEWTPTQILFGEYFNDIKMIRNLVHHTLQEQSPQTNWSKTSIDEGVRKFINKRYRTLALITHPDRGTEEKKEMMTTLFNRIKSAKETLDFKISQGG